MYTGLNRIIGCDRKKPIRSGVRDVLQEYAIFWLAIRKLSLEQLPIGNLGSVALNVFISEFPEVRTGQLGLFPGNADPPEKWTPPGISLLP
jgi:hypothetical protein